ncbi:MAG TPA: SRPBCC domain-containing protein [Ferruginibacter sp.]|nr:SRPBCC domain-containing protein [Ferruginibacter sp.]
MRQDLTVSRSVIINRSQDKVWYALANLAIIQEYLFGSATNLKWEDGNEIIFHGKYNGHKYLDLRIVFENILDKKVSYNYFTETTEFENKTENHSIIIYNLLSCGDKETKLTWTHKGYIDEERHKYSSDKMETFLHQIKKIIEG